MGREEREPLRKLEATLAETAEVSGAELHRYPRKGQPARHVTLRDLHDDGGSRSLVASLEVGGAIRVSGRDAGPAVSEAWGSSITTYEWVYIVAPDRVENLVMALGGERGDDVLLLLAARCQQGENIEAVLRSPEVAAGFANWHS